MKSKSTILVSIQVYKSVTKTKEIIVFASLINIKDKRDTKLVIVDYFAISDTETLQLILLFNYE